MIGNVNTIILSFMVRILIRGILSKLLVIKVVDSRVLSMVVLPLGDLILAVSRVIRLHTRIITI